MGRQVLPLTVDRLSLLVEPCSTCSFWELTPAQSVGAATRAVEAKRGWLTTALLEWGTPGRIALVDGVPAGYVTYAPAHLVPRAMAFPTAPVSEDAVVLLTARIAPEYAGQGLGRALIQAAAKDTVRRGIRAVEAFARTGPRRRSEPGVASSSAQPVGRSGGYAAEQAITPDRHEPNQVSRDGLPSSSLLSRSTDPSMRAAIESSSDNVVTEQVWLAQIMSEPASRADACADAGTTPAGLSAVTPEVLDSRPLNALAGSSAAPPQVVSAPIRSASPRGRSGAQAGSNPQTSSSTQERGRPSGSAFDSPRSTGTQRVGTLSTNPSAARAQPPTADVSIASPARASDAPRPRAPGGLTMTQGSEASAGSSSRGRVAAESPEQGRRSAPKGRPDKSPQAPRGRRDEGRGTWPADHCLLPVEFLTAVGFYTVRDHPAYPRMRLDLRTALRWREEVESAVERLFTPVRSIGTRRPVGTVNRSGPA